MKNKKLMYLLVPGVFLVWGLIFYQMKETLSGGGYEENSIPAKPGKLETKKKQVSPLTLLANYRDPFLETNIFLSEPIQADVVQPEMVQNTSGTPLIAEIAPIAWPIIEYLGMIENSATGARVSLVRLGNQQFFLKEKELRNNIGIEKIYSDSVKVRFGKNVKYIRKK